MPGRGLNLLSLDGGGIRGLSSLQVLKNILERVARERGLPAPPKPCDFFDMIGGTSTGGLIAIMLGRMKMTIDECIEAYVQLSDSVFRQTHALPFSFTGKVRGKFDSKALEAAVKEYLRKCSLPEDCLLQDIDQGSCKVFVCATSGSTRKTVVLSSYSTRRTNTDRLKYTKVWQAARATSAASSFFDPIEVQLGSYKESYTDGATGANNPINFLWHEAKEAFLEPNENLEDNIDCVISIGTGVPAIEPFGSSLKAIAKTVVAISTETEDTAKVFKRTHENLVKSERYFRFNVTHGLEVIGLERTDRKDDIVNITNLYLEEDETHELMERCVNTLKQHEGESLFDFASNGAITVRNDRRVTSRHRSSFIGLNDRRVAQRGRHTLLDNISMYDDETRLLSISTRVVPGTAQWLLANKDFALWKSQTSRQFFLCTGIVGSGKTMLASSIVEASICEHDNSRGIIAHYFLDAKYPHELSVTALLRGIIRQLVSQLQETKSLPPWLVDILQKTFAHSACYYSCPTLHGVLQKLVSIPVKTTIIIDGLHEMTEKDTSALLDIIRHLALQPTITEKVKFAIFSREQVGRSVNIATAFPDLIHIRLTIDLLEKDIAFFIDERIRQKTMYERQLSENKNMLNELRSTLIENGGKMFLWIDLQLITIWNTCFNDEDIRIALEGLPIGIEDTYLRCLSRLSRDPITSKYGHRILYLTAYAQRPLNQLELRDAISVPDMSDHWDRKKLFNGPLLQHCANLVEQDHLTAVIRFVHPSVKAFLVSHPTQHHAVSILTGKTYGPRGGFETIAEEYCRDTCFRYLMMHDFGSQVALKNTARTAFSNAEVIDKALQGGNKMTRWTARQLAKTRNPEKKSHTTWTRQKKPQEIVGEGQVYIEMYRLLAYVQEHWPSHARSLQPTDSAWPFFVAIVTTVNSAYKLHPWLEPSMNPIEIQQSLFAYAIQTDNMPLLWTIQETIKPKKLALLMQMSLTDRGEQACHLAISRDALNWIIKVSGKKQLLSKDAAGNTALHSSAINGNVEALELILEHFSAADLLTSRNKSNKSPLTIAIEGYSLAYVTKAMQALQVRTQKLRRPPWKAHHLQDELTTLFQLRPNAGNRLPEMEPFIKILMNALLEEHQDVSWTALMTLAFEDDIYIFFELFLEHPNSRSKIAGTLTNKPPDAPKGASILTQACTISTTTKSDRSRIVELLLEYLPEEITWHTVIEKEGADKVEIITPLSLAMSQVVVSEIAADIVLVLSRQLLKLSQQRKYVPQMIEEFGRPPNGDLDYMEIMQRVDPESVKNLLMSGALKFQQPYDDLPKTNLLHVAVMKEPSEDLGLIEAIADAALQMNDRFLVYYLSALNDNGKTTLALAVDNGRTDHAACVLRMIVRSLNFENIFFAQRYKDGNVFRNRANRLLLTTLKTLPRVLDQLLLKPHTEDMSTLFEGLHYLNNAKDHITSWGFQFEALDQSHEEALMRDSEKENTAPLPNLQGPISQLIQDFKTRRSEIRAAQSPGRQTPQHIDPTPSAPVQAPLYQASRQLQSLDLAPPNFQNALPHPDPLMSNPVSPPLSAKPGSPSTPSEAIAPTQDTDLQSHRSSLSGESVYLSASEGNDV